MKTKFIAALLAASALTAASASATVVKFTGDLYLGAGSQTGSDANVDDLDPVFIGGKGSLYIPIKDTKLSVTFDMFAESGNGVVEFVSDGDYFTFGGAGHFTYTHGNRYSLGLVGALMAAEAPPNEEPDYWLFAAEGKFMLDRGSVWGQVGYFDSFDDDVFPDFLTEMSFARVGVTHYLEDDLKFLAEASFYDGRVEDTDPASLSIYRVELEHKVFERVSIYGSYQYLTMDNTDPSELDDVQSNVFNVGIRVRLGANDRGTLMSHEQTNSLGVPPVLHAIGLSNRYD
jgi:opacity protein-like surface antigen